MTNEKSTGWGALPIWEEQAELGVVFNIMLFPGTLTSVMREQLSKLETMVKIDKPRNMSQPDQVDPWFAEHDMLLISAPFAVGAVLNLLNESGVPNFDKGRTITEEEADKYYQIALLRLNSNQDHSGDENA